MWPNTQETADLVTFNEEILNGKLHFLCSDNCNTAKSIASMQELYWGISPTRVDVNVGWI